MKQISKLFHKNNINFTINGIIPLTTNEYHNGTVIFGQCLTFTVIVFAPIFLLQAIPEQYQNKNRRIDVQECGETVH